MLENLYQHFIKHPIVTTDSRHVPQGSIFFALKGDNFDGNKFAQSALELGASMAVIDNPEYLSEGCFLVDNVLRTLQSLANYHRRKLGIKIIGITGSNGKTTTKELLAAVLSMKYNVYATKGNLNNHIGVPLTLLSLTSNNDLAIVEMGANHPGDIKELAEIAEPNYGLITNIGRAHLGGFGSFEGVISTKAELYGFIEKGGDKVFYNQTNSIINDLIVRYHLEKRSVAYSSFCSSYDIIREMGNPFLALKVKLDDETILVQSNLVGDYNAENLLAAITVGRYFDVDITAIKNAIESYTPTNNRSQFLKTDKNTVIMDAYNANPSSMDAAIRNFASLNSFNKKVIIGEMLELGEYSEVEHKRIVELLVSLGFQDVFLVGDGFRSVHDKYLFFSNSDECMDYLKNHSISGCTILLKGSRGVRLEKLMELL
ncbi:MAG TPA: UDP-N-acetylmuramoyl-tripeptide--D-alanyl-D-alanine ligase [Tenuifilaceae bacterium]|nr:UDP-N-acetylmuramoyl-tripeptide--D-alanyl-D-alanine ligase [Tenuifilaceae bacterium]